MRTDKVDGFLLDRGFQVLLTGYPEAQQQLDYDRLDLRALEPGALVRHAGSFHRFADPFRRPLQALPALLDRTISLADKLRVARLRRHASKEFQAGVSSRKEISTAAYLTGFGFCVETIERFFQPFLEGYFSKANWPPQATGSFICFICLPLGRLPSRTAGCRRFRTR